MALRFEKAFGVDMDTLMRMQNSYDIAVRREQSLDASLQGLTAARGNSAVYLKLQQLRRVVDADRKLYENYLSQFGNVRVMTTGNGVDANNIVVKAAFTTPDSTSLSLSGVGGFG